MIRRINRSILLATASALLLAATSSQAAMTFKVAEKAPPKELSEAFQGKLQSKAVQVLKGDRPVFEFWMAKSIPIPSKPDSLTKSLRAFSETAVVGAASVGDGQRDYRDDPIAPGVYTMRFGLQPQDGDHLGKSMYPYFVVLTPASLDPDPKGLSTFKEMVKASAKNKASGHPTVLSLFPASKPPGDHPEGTEPSPDNEAVRLSVPGTVEGGGEATLVFDLVYEGHGEL